MPAIATTGLPQDPGFANLTHKIVQLVMASAGRASVAAGGVPNVKLPQDRKSLEYAFEPLFSGRGARERQLRRAFGRPGGRVPLRLTGIDFADNRSVIEQAILGTTLDPVKIAPATFARWQTGRSQQEI